MKCCHGSLISGQHILGRCLKTVGFELYDVYWMFYRASFLSIFLIIFLLNKIETRATNYPTNYPLKFLKCIYVVFTYCKYCFDKYHVFCMNVGSNLLPELVGGGEQDQGVDHELRVDEHVADDDEGGGEDPAMEANHQHSRNI